MGDPRKQRSKYSKPSHPWQSDRIEEEKKLLKEYGLKNKREIWKAVSLLSKFKDNIKRLSTDHSKQAETERQQILSRIKRYGLLDETGTSEDVLGLTVRDVLNRRLQTIVFKKGLARTVKQARQFIVHEMIVVNGRKVSVPSYIVKVSEQNSIGFYEGSALSNPEHPERVNLEKKKLEAEKEKLKKEKEEKGTEAETEAESEKNLDSNVEAKSETDSKKEATVEN